MLFKNFLEKHQPILYKSLSESFINKKVSHAYLLTGESGTPLKETAYFIAKSLLCDNPTPLADESCQTCERIEHNLYTDLLFLDGSLSSIKKDDVLDLINLFSKTPNENKGVMVYIIHLVENMTSEATNALLKFLEEPSNNCYAILTSQNPAKVLPTIISRCEVLRLLLLPLDEVIIDAVANDVTKTDAEILAHFYNSSELIRIEKEKDSYIKAKSAFVIALQSLGLDKDECIFHFEKEINELVGNKEGCRYFLDMLSLAYHDLIAIKNKQKISLTTYQQMIEQISTFTTNPTNDLKTILTIRDELELNISPSLLLDHLAFELTKGRQK